MDLLEPRYPSGLDNFGFVYVGDAMCSWCWGFAPVMPALANRYDLPIHVVAGGLRPGPDARPLDERMRTFLTKEWAKIAETTGQPFDASAVTDRPDTWLYNTELPAVAVTAYRERSLDGTFAFFEMLQRSFYAEGVDVTDPEIYPTLADGWVDDPTAFAASLTEKDQRKIAWRDFAFAQQLGATGFPTLLIGDKQELTLVTRGYQPLEVLQPALDEWLTVRND